MSFCSYRRSVTCYLYFTSKFTYKTASLPVVQAGFSGAFFVYGTVDSSLCSKLRIFDEWPEKEPNYLLGSSEQGVI